MNRINLVPKHKIPKKTLRISIISFISISIILFSYISYSIYIEEIQEELLLADVQNIENEINRMQVYEEYKRDLDLMRDQVEEIQTDYQKGRLKESQILSIIESITPDKFEYGSMEIYASGEVILSDCRARTYEVVASFLKNIKDTTLINSIEISAITIDKTVQDKNVLEMFPDRGESYVIVGDITTTEMFEDAFWFDVKFQVLNNVND
ncbi:MAG: hypothetical protein ACOCRO_03060 [Halanaerobiales bacterium]